MHLKASNFYQDIPAFLAKIVPPKAVVVNETMLRFLARFVPPKVGILKNLILLSFK